MTDHADNPAPVSQEQVNGILTRLDAIGQDVHNNRMDWAATAGTVAGLELRLDDLEARNQPEAVESSTPVRPASGPAPVSQEQVNGILKRLNALAKIPDGISEALKSSNVMDKGWNLSAIVGTLYDQLKNIRADVQDLRKDRHDTSAVRNCECPQCIREHIDRIRNRLNGIDDSLDRIDANLTRIDALEARLKAHESGIDEYGNPLSDTFADRLRHVERKIFQLESDKVQGIRSLLEARNQQASPPVIDKSSTTDDAHPTNCACPDCEPDDKVDVIADDIYDECRETGALCSPLTLRAIHKVLRKHNIGQPIPLADLLADERMRPMVKVVKAAIEAMTKKGVGSGSIYHAVDALPPELRAAMEAICK